MSEEWIPSTDLVMKWIEDGITRDQWRVQVTKFRNYWMSKSGKDATRADWNPVLDNWLIKAKEDGDLKLT